MKLLLLYGPPAVGKLTIGREVAARTGWRLFHNHLVVDLVLSVYDFGTPGFVALREEMWLAVFRRARADRLPGLIFTFNPENSVPQRFIDEFVAEFAACGGEVVPIELTASEPELERRMGAASRQQHGKLVDLALYRKLRDAGVFRSPVMPSPRLRVDTGQMTPPAAAEKIIAALRQSAVNPEPGCASTGHE